MVFFSSFFNNLRIYYNDIYIYIIKFNDTERDKKHSVLVVQIINQLLGSVILDFVFLQIFKDQVSTLMINTTDLLILKIKKKSKEFVIQ